MRRSASIALVSLLAACGAHADVDTGVTGTAPTASSVAAGPRLVARDLGEGYCGTFYSYCPMFVLGDRVFFRATTAPDAPAPFTASIRSADVSGSGAPALVVASTDDASNLFGPFLGGDGIEWLVQSADATTTTLFTGSGTNATARVLGTIASGALVASDDPESIYVFTTSSTLVRLAKTDGSATLAGALDGFVPIAAVADTDPQGFLYATGSGGIVRLSKSSALLETISTNATGSPFGDRLSVGAGQLFAAEEAPSTSTILARPLAGGLSRMVATSAGGSSGIVVDGDDVYWIAVASGDGSDVSSELWSAPLAGGASTQLFAEPARPIWLTGVAFGTGSIYMTTSDGRLLALAK